jgi:hypothetical protein
VLEITEEDILDWIGFEFEIEIESVVVFKEV